jgi:hypothetical protein
MVGSERQHVLNVNLQLFASIVRGCGALQIGVEGTTTTTTANNYYNYKAYLCCYY